jgi:hypothetical protein
MKSRYVLTKKHIEDFALEDAISADEVLDYLNRINQQRRSVAMLCKATQSQHSLTWRPAPHRCIETLSSLQLKSWLAWDGSLVLQISHRHFILVILVTRSTGSYMPSNLQKDLLMQNEASSFD